MSALILPSRLTQQPQQFTAIDYENEFLKGGALLALILGSQPSHNLADGKPLTISGAKPTRSTTGKGRGIFNAGNAGDVGCVIEASTTAPFFDFFYGYIGYNAATVNQYLFGDHAGVTNVGYAIAAAHGSTGNGWALFNGSTLNQSGESRAVLMDGRPHLILVTREKASGASSKVYLDGVLKITSTATISLNSKFAVGSLGINQYGSFGCESNTHLAGRVVGKGLTAAEVKRFTENPWQIFKAPPRRLWFVGAGGGPQSLVVTPTGGIAFSGAAEVIKSAIKQPVGGLSFGGAAPMARGAARAASGGLVLSGAAAVARGAVRDPAGGILFAGTAPYSSSSGNQTLTVTPTGGVAFAGAAAVQRQMRYVPVGGLNFAGSAPYSNSGLPASEPFSFKRRRILRRHFTP